MESPQHDPLCPSHYTFTACECALIASVREDERQSSSQVIPAIGGKHPDVCSCLPEEQSLTEWRGRTICDACGKTSG